MSRTKIPAYRMRGYQEVHRRVERGLLTPRPCEQCGVPETVAHHENCSKPLAITWLCHSCHGKRHVEMADANPSQPRRGRRSNLSHYPRVECSDYPPVLMREVARRLNSPLTYPYSLARQGYLACHNDSPRGLAVTQESLESFLDFGKKGG